LEFRRTPQRHVLCRFASLPSESPISGGAEAGQSVGAAHDQASDKAAASRATIPGKVGTDGKTFTADKDSRIWMVSNPEALSGIDGRHAKIKAIVDTARSQLLIVSVSAIAEQRAGIKA
jgi:hypothetical protein